jgi:hypothetical protein
MPEGLPRWWTAALTGLAALRVALPLAALAAAPGSVPGQPDYERGPFTGDATGYYAAVRELVSVFGSHAPLAAALLAGVAVAALGALALRRRRRVATWVALTIPALAAGIALAVLVRFMNPSGAGALGWPLVWSIPSLPLRLLGRLDPDSAFVVGLVLSLAAVAVTVVATGFIGLYATGSPGIGALAGGLYAAWPFLSGLVAGERGWSNGTWETDLGLHMYSEPVSTAAATSVVALLLRPRLSPTLAWVVGVLAGFAVLARLSNFLLAVLALGFVLWREGVRVAVPVVAGGLVWLAPLVSFWPIGYTPYLDEAGQFPAYAFSLDFAAESWADSRLWHPTTLLVLAPLALVGLLAVRRPAALLLGTWIATTAAFYTLYEATAEHPRFLFAALPALLALEAAGAAALVLAGREKAVRRSPG